MSWKRRTPYINAYNDLRQKNLDDIKELREQVRQLQYMVEYMASVMWPKKEEK